MRLFISQFSALDIFVTNLRFKLRLGHRNKSIAESGVFLGLIYSLKKALIIRFAHELYVYSRP